MAILLSFCNDLQQKIPHKGRENSKLQDLQRQEGSGECIWNPGKQIQHPTGHEWSKGQRLSDIVLTCVAQHAEDTPRWSSQSRRTVSEIGQVTTLGKKEAGIYQSFSGLPNYSKNFYLS